MRNCTFRLLATAAALVGVAVSIDTAHAVDIDVGYVSDPKINGKQLQDALNTAHAGDKILLKNSLFVSPSPDGVFTIPAKPTDNSSSNDSTSSFVTVTCKNHTLCTVQSPFVVNRKFAHLDWLRLEGDKSLVTIYADGVQLTNSIVKADKTQNTSSDLESRAVMIETGTNVLIARNDIYSWRIGVSIKPDPSLPNPISTKVCRNYIHSDGVYVQNSNNYEAVEVGTGTGDRLKVLSASVYKNRIEDFLRDGEVVSVKSSGSTIDSNTMVNTRSLTNRHGRNNIYKNNWIKNGTFIVVNDYGNSILNNKMSTESSTVRPGLAANKNILLVAGQVNYSSSIMTPCHIPATSTIVAGNNVGAIESGFKFGLDPYCKDSNEEPLDYKFHTKDTCISQDAISKYSQINGLGDSPSTTCTAPSTPIPAELTFPADVGPSSTSSGCN